MLPRCLQRPFASFISLNRSLTLAIAQLVSAPRKLESPSRRRTRTPRQKHQSIVWDEIPEKDQKKQRLDKLVIEEHGAEEFRNSHDGSIADAGAGTGSSYLCCSNCDGFKHGALTIAGGDH